MNDPYMADRMYTNALQRGMDDKFRRISAARVVGGVDGGSTWTKAISEAAYDYRQRGKKFSLKKPADVRYAKSLQRQLDEGLGIHPKRRVTKKKKSGSKALRLVGPRRKALRKTPTGRCSVYEPKNPKYWKEDNGRCILYSTHLKKSRKPKKKVARKRRGGVFLGDGEYEGDGLLLGGCDGCPYCGSGEY